MGRIALVGVGHWHAEMYLQALQALGEDVVAISDPDRDALDRVPLDCPRYRDVGSLLRDHEPEFVFAFAPHRDMTELAAQLVAAGQPFAMEKPMGLDWRQLAQVAQDAERRGVFAAVALVSRYFPLVTRLRQLKDAGELGRPVHLYYRLLAGPPRRYRDLHVPWMLDPLQAGAGPLYNFGPHVVDLFLRLADAQVATVSAAWSHGVYGEPIEDLAALLLVGSEGAVGVCEVGYTVPTAYERHFSLTTDALHYGGPIEAGRIIRRRGEPLEVTAALSATETYDVYVADTLVRFRQGRPAIATIQDMVPVLRVLNAARQACETGGTVRVSDL